LQYFLDTGYLHLKSKDEIKSYPIEFYNDTLILYVPKPGYGFFKETYLQTNFNDSTLNVMKKYGVNYPELAGNWMLVREEDFDYGTHYELEFPYSIPDSIEFTREQMISALEGDRIFKMLTNGTKREYTFFYRAPYIYIEPGSWYKEEDSPLIYFYSL
jgi:hypothetical protein